MVTGGGFNRTAKTLCPSRLYGEYLHRGILHTGFGLAEWILKVNPAFRSGLSIIRGGPDDLPGDLHRTPGEKDLGRCWMRGAVWETGKAPLSWCW